MPRTERTSKSVASKAGKALRDPKASKREKSVAASALTQREEPIAMGGLQMALDAAYRWLKHARHHLRTLRKPARKASKAKRR